MSVTFPERAAGTSSRDASMTLGSGRHALHATCIEHSYLVEAVLSVSTDGIDSIQWQ